MIPGWTGLMLAVTMARGAEPATLDGAVVQLEIAGKPVARFDAVDPARVAWSAVDSHYGEDRQLAGEVSGAIALQLRDLKGRWGRKTAALQTAFPPGEAEATLRLVVTRSTPTIPAGTRCVLASGPAVIQSFAASPEQVAVTLGWRGEPSGGGCEAVRGDPGERER